MSETRNYNSELRVSGDKAPVLDGTAVVYNSVSKTLYSPKIGNFKEIVLPGALKQSLNSSDEILADLNHVPSQIIGRRSKGTLILNDTATGLRARISPPDTSWGRDTIEAVRHGDYSGMSFQFVPNAGGERFYRNASGETVRELSSIKLERVSVVDDPAYSATNVELRSASIELAEKELELNNINRNIVTAVAATII